MLKNDVVNDEHVTKERLGVKGGEILPLYERPIHTFQGPYTHYFKTDTSDYVTFSDHGLLKNLKTEMIRVC